MKLKELKNAIDNVYECIHEDIADNLEVVITLDEASIGDRSKCGIKATHRGFDWEMNQFRIEPSTILIRRK